MYEEAKDATNKKSEMIRKNAFILVNCGPYNFHKIWAFYKGVLYVADVPSGPSGTNINIDEVNFFPEDRLPSQTNYSRKGNKLFWNGNFAVRPGESWEYSLDSNTMYRKLPWGDIKTEECPTRIENGKP